MKEIPRRFGGGLWLVFNLYDEEGDDPTTRQLKRFFQVVLKAAELEKTLTVDV